MRAAQGERLQAPNSSLFSQFQTGGPLIALEGRRLVAFAVILLHKPKLGLSIKVVSVSDATPRRIALDAVDCFIVSDNVAGPSIDGAIDLWWNEPWKVGFSTVGPDAALAISHKHWVRYEVPGAGLIERMSWRDPMSNDAVEIERLDADTYRLHMCEDIVVKGKRCIQLDALVLDVTLKEEQEIDAATLRAKDRKRKIRPRQSRTDPTLCWPPDGYPGILQFD